MSKRWRIDNRDFFIRDLVRDYCKVHIILKEQAARFAHSGTISFAVLNELLGDAMRKGFFWRLKDAAHHLFRTPHTPLDNKQNNNEKTSDTLAEMLDWCVGYAFHECVKLKEDAFQRQHYSNRLLQIKASDNNYGEVLQGLLPFTEQTNESISRELERILGVLVQIGNLLLLFLEQHKENKHVARLLVEHRELIQKSFDEHFDVLLHKLYGSKPSKCYELALEVALECGRLEQASEIIAKAREVDIDHQTLEHMGNTLINATQKVS